MKFSRHKVSVIVSWTVIRVLNLNEDLKWTVKICFMGKEDGNYYLSIIFPNSITVCILYFSESASDKSLAPTTTLCRRLEEEMSVQSVLVQLDVWFMVFKSVQNTLHLWQKILKMKGPRIVNQFWLTLSFW